MTQKLNGTIMLALSASILILAFAFSKRYANELPFYIAAAAICLMPVIRGVLRHRRLAACERNGHR